jgi:Xaa-Pro aminopeptidase
MLSTSARIARLRRLAGSEADAWLLTRLPDLLYLVGFHGSAGVLVVTRREAIFFAPGLYGLQAREEIAGAEVRVVAGDPLQAAAKWLRRRAPKRVLYDPAHLTAARLRQVGSVVGPGTELAPTAGGVATLRAVKEKAEITRIRASQEVTARVFNEVLPLVRPGVRELDLAAEIEYRMKLHGARSPAFETIVASGPRSALPHGRASRKRLARNELVVFDLGAILCDYCSDMTRTVYLGKPPARVQRVYGAVREALERARQAVRPGVPAGRVDAAARRCLGRRGWGRYFVHGTGHGLGLEIHEEPRVAPRVATRLEAGHVITLEPGVYVPGWGGVRIEDVVAVGARGAEGLTPLSSELICL